VDWLDTEEQAAFREEVREFLRTRVPDRYQPTDDDDSGGEIATSSWQLDRKSDDPAARKAAQDWTQALASKGWIAPSWPKEYGGAGLSPMEQFIYNMEMARAGVSGVGGSGVSRLGPTLIVHGTQEQRDEHLPVILAGNVAWAQGYSEPGAGSDLAALVTRADRQGDEYVVNGQKIWTSGAHAADWIFCLVRTDTEAPKHRGISFLMIDMETPGITVRPLVNMAWQHGFNEVFFEDVRVPLDHRVGEENAGWYVGMTLLDFERSNISGAVSGRRNLDKLVSAVREHAVTSARMDESPSLKLQLADRYIETEVMFNFSLRIISMQTREQLPNYEASVSKLFSSEMDQRIAGTGVKIFGLYGNLWDRANSWTPVGGALPRSYIGTVMRTIGQGTSEIQRNIIATRGLGLPRG
jgi:alkylation response protein AidB-like acyl-CoA dehydrogenase